MRSLLKLWLPFCLVLWIPAGMVLATSTASDPTLSEASGGRWLNLSKLPEIFEDEEIHRQLESGLTTTFAFSVEGRGGIEGGARAEIRYLLWDEVFQVTILEITGSVRREAFPSREALASWWKEVELAVLDRRALPADPVPQLRVRLDVVPFSSKEEADTQRWLSETLTRAGEERTRVSRPGERPGTSLGQVFNVLLATSIRRRAVRSYRWTLPLPLLEPSTAPSHGGRP